MDMEYEMSVASGGFKRSGAPFGEVSRSLTAGRCKVPHGGSAHGVSRKLPDQSRLEENASSDMPPGAVGALEKKMPGPYSCSRAVECYPEQAPRSGQCI